MYRYWQNCGALHFLIKERTGVFHSFLYLYVCDFASLIGLEVYLLQIKHESSLNDSEAPILFLRNSLN
jgi:hypothetical protein